MLHQRWGKNKAAVPRAFMGAYPSQRCLSHAAYVSLCPLAATVVSELHCQRGEEKKGVKERWGCKCVAALMGVGRDASWSVSA